MDEYDDEGGLSAFVGRHRFAIAGVTAFVVAFSYVTSNAIWYQPHAHASAFFQTRPLTAPLPAQRSGEAPQAAGRDVETVIRLERERTDTPLEPPVPAPRQEAAEAVPIPQAVPTPPVVADQPAQPRPAGDPVIADVQRVLKDLNIYSGDVDGLTGPQTRTAVETYRRIVGLSATAEIDAPLLTQLGIQQRAAPVNVAAADARTENAHAVAATSVPVPQVSPGTDLIETSSARPREDATVMRIQAGLKAFGNEGIDVDGVVGARTKSAIVEFQSLFGLPETGEPDEKVLNKMREIGLTN